MAQAIVTKFLCATNTRGSRILVKSWQGATTWNYDHVMDSNDNHAGAIRAHIMHISKRAWDAGHEVDYKIVGEVIGENWRWLAANPDGKGYTAIVI